jgi:hypothetical protein
VTRSGDDVVGFFAGQIASRLMKRCRRARPLGQYRIVTGGPHNSEAPRRVDRSARMHPGGRAHPEIQSRLAGSEQGAAQLVHAELIFRRGTPPDARNTLSGTRFAPKRVACIMFISRRAASAISKHHAEPAGLHASGLIVGHSGMDATSRAMIAG